MSKIGTATFLCQAVVCSVLLAFAARSASAQALDLGVTAVGLVSMEPVEDPYLGGPYLSAQLGRFGTGIGLGLNGITAGGFAFAADLTWATDTEPISGRLINGGGEDQGRIRSYTQHQSVVSGFGGYATPRGTTRAVFLIGVSKVINQVTQDGERRPPFDLPLTISGGVDVSFLDASRVALLATVRYTPIRYPDHRGWIADQQVLRVGGGVRIRVDD